MKQSINHYISEFLYLHDCVIIPGFGGFICNISPAKIDKANSIIIPPSKKIGFNKNLIDNDGLLINHVSKHENISINNAENHVRTFSADLITKLRSNKILRIDNIGLFTYGKENNITFTQDNLNNYNISVFGMNNLSAQEVNRLKEAEKKLDNVIANIKSNNQLQKRILRVAAIIIPLIALSYVSISQQEKINSIYTHMSNLNPFSEFIRKSTYKNTNNISITPIKKGDKTIIKNVISEQKYYIIAGSFIEQKNAKKMQDKLKKLDYKSEIITEGKRRRVSYASFSNREDAILVLNNIRKSNKEAWLLSE